MSNQPPKASWAKVAAKSNPDPQLQIIGHWYCPLPVDNVSFIVNSALQIAEEWGCSYVAIRSDIHNTTTTRNRMTGQKQINYNQPYHFTLEFQNRKKNAWMAAHAYTDTEEIKVNGFKYRKTHGMAKLEKLKEKNIASNPEFWFNVKPKCLQMKKGEAFDRKFSAAGYKPIAW